MTRDEVVGTETLQYCNGIEDKFLRIILRTCYCRSLLKATPVQPEREARKFCDGILLVHTVCISNGMQHTARYVFGQTAFASNVNFDSHRVVVHATYCMSHTVHLLCVERLFATCVKNCCVGYVPLQLRLGSHLSKLVHVRYYALFS